MHFNLQDEKGFSAMRSFKTCTLTAGKYSFVIKIGVVPFTCFLELNHLREASVTKHTKVPVLNIECPFTLSSCLEGESVPWFIMCHVQL